MHVNKKADDQKDRLGFMVASATSNLVSMYHHVCQTSHQRNSALGTLTDGVRSVCEISVNNLGQPNSVQSFAINMKKGANDQSRSFDFIATSAVSK